jgi:hypothetical protein
MAQVLDAVEETIAALLPSTPARDEAVERYRATRRTDRDAFETHIAPMLEHEQLTVVRDTKALIRARVNAVATDAIDVFSLREGEELNGAAIELRDSIGANHA